MTNVETRLLEHILEDAVTGCWNCTYRSAPTGYPRITVEGRVIRCSHIAYQLWVGAIPEGLCVLHKCDNPRCVNPTHLWIGTQLENMEDRDAKGRQSKGEKHRQAASRGVIHSAIMRRVAARGDNNGTKTHPEKFRGSNHWRAKLTETNVREIRSYKKQGCKLKDIITFTKLSSKAVEGIFYGTSWRHLA